MLRRYRVWPAVPAGKSATHIAMDSGRGNLHSPGPLYLINVCGIRRRFTLTHQNCAISPHGRGQPSKLSKHDMRILQTDMNRQSFISIRELKVKCAPHVQKNTIRSEFGRHAQKTGVTHCKFATYKAVDEHSKKRKKKEVQFCPLISVYALYSVSSHFMHG